MVSADGVERWNAEYGCAKEDVCGRADGAEPGAAWAEFSHRAVTAAFVMAKGDDELDGSGGMGEECGVW